MTNKTAFAIRKSLISPVRLSLLSDCTTSSVEIASRVEVCIRIQKQNIPWGYTWSPGQPHCLFFSPLQEVFEMDCCSNRLTLKHVNRKAKYCLQAQTTIPLQAKSSTRSAVKCVTTLWSHRYEHTHSHLRSGGVERLLSQAREDRCRADHWLTAESCFGEKLLCPWD